jgi:hypothetical protein
MQEWQSSFRALRRLKSPSRASGSVTHAWWWTLVMRKAGTRLYTLCCPLTVVLFFVVCPRYAEACRICHLEGIIGDNPCRTSNILAFVTAGGLPTQNDLTDMSLFRCFRIFISASAYPPYIVRPFYSMASLILTGTLILTETFSTPLSNFSSLYALCKSVWALYPARSV